MLLEISAPNASDVAQLLDFLNEPSFLASPSQIVSFFTDLDLPFPARVPLMLVDQGTLQRCGSQKDDASQLDGLCINYNIKGSR